MLSGGKILTYSSTLNLAWNVLNFRMGIVHALLDAGREVAVLVVTSRKLVWFFPKQLWLKFVPVLH